MLACAPPVSAATVYESVYKCEGGNGGSGENNAAYRGFLCTNEIKMTAAGEGVTTNLDARRADVLMNQLSDVKNHLEKLKGNVDFEGLVTRNQLTRERDSLTQQLQAYSEIEH